LFLVPFSFPRFRNDAPLATAVEAVLFSERSEGREGRKEMEGRKGRCTSRHARPPIPSRSRLVRWSSVIGSLDLRGWLRVGLVGRGDETARR
jgi:hypothetical protein